MCQQPAFCGFRQLHAAYSTLDLTRNPLTGKSWYLAFAAYFALLLCFLLIHNILTGLPLNIDTLLTWTPFLVPVHGVCNNGVQKNIVLHFVVHWTYTSHMHMHVVVLVYWAQCRYSSAPKQTLKHCFCSMSNNPGNLCETIFWFCEENCM